ncbi:family 78 glycoside hydrolase catalytic domain [Paenibacillus abyssi]|uniref:alpha-L-rhamnosidase n=1 Tax=Paenibacillus abyssi TaxID=1340531 RepID=A0A917CXI1_9BACL|nr:family 78 glycoside hydrolase catalytic domain [Paenibacillus abyssi]GGG00197.1 hydrolase [Paenibacillus abyssi]
MTIKQLLVESQSNTLGIDVKEPLLSWEFGGSYQRSTIQEAYRILVSDDIRKVSTNIGDIWDSGVVQSRKNVNIIYKGKQLQSNTRYYWKVQVWDNHGNQIESDISWWEMGLLDPEEWTGTWITRGNNADSSAPFFRYEFNLTKKIEKARVYICGLGHYELRLNGKRVGDRVLEPGWTNYDKTCLYSVYDVTDYLYSLETNAIGVILGNGFFHVPGGRYTKFKNSFGEPRCLVQMEVTYYDGTVEKIVSNNNWHTSSSPLTFSCMYGGEDYDANKEQAGWDKPGFIYNSPWKKAVEIEAPKGKLVSQKSTPLKIMKTFEPKEIKKLDHDKYLIDFGQNFSGWVEITVAGSKNQAVKIIPAEILNKDGSPNQTWSGSPYKFNYTLKGDEEETWSPRFTYYGFRYVQIEGAVPVSFDSKAATKLLNIQGQMIYPEMEISGYFKTSDQMINRIHEIINWAILSNMKSVFTDCPHREKLGWLEQVHLMGPSILYNYSVEPLFTKIMEDIKDAQLQNGMIPTTAPEYVVFEKPWDIFRHSVSWGATYIISAWYIYQKFGNDRLIIDHYNGMKNYISYLCEQSEDYIIVDGLGDWYDVGEKGPGFAQNTPVPLAETAMFYHIVDIFTNMTKLFSNNEKDTTYYEYLSHSIKDSFNHTFFDANTGQYGNGSQASNAMPLSVGLVGEKDKETVFNYLVENIIKHDYHTTAGDVGYRYVLQALSENNRSDIIFEMIRKVDYPSYGYQVVNGATSLTEAWDGPTVGKSQNHFMLGHIEEWFYNSLGGLNYSFDSKKDAYYFTIKPYIPSDLKYVKAGNRLLVGEVKSEWEQLENGRLKVNIHIPVNSEARVFLPAASIDEITENGAPVQTVKDIKVIKVKNGIAELELGSGEYEFLTTIQALNYSN